MRAANLFIFLGTVGFINIYEEMTSDDDGTGKLDHSDVKRLQRKFGVKEKRSATLLNGAGPAGSSSGAALAFQGVNFADYSEVQLIEHLKRPVYRGLADCARADGATCNCLRLLCFGQAECTEPAATSKSIDSGGINQRTSQPPVEPADPRYIYYATGARLRAKQRSSSLSSSQQQDRLLRCRQTTIDPYVLCECKIYARNPA